MEIVLHPDRIEDYRLFLKIKALPRYQFEGRLAIIPDEYAHLLGVETESLPTAEYTPAPFLFDYQRDISRLAIRKRKFAIFARPGLGKTLCAGEFARHCMDVLPNSRSVLMLSPLMVCKQTIRELKQFYGNSFAIEYVPANRLAAWAENPTCRFGITNYESLRDDVPQGSIGCLIADESSILKSHYGVYGAELIRLGKGLHYKLCLTGTPAPNDRIEYANHAVFLDRFPTINSFLARYFVNRGQTNNRWELKAHALRPFYRSLSDWCIFLDNPATYGWKDNANGFPPIHVHIHDVELTEEQRAVVHKAGGDMYGTPGGIGSRSKIARLAKGWFNDAAIPTKKPEFIRNLLSTWEKDESTIIWCKYNKEQELLERVIPNAGSITGETPHDQRERIIEDFQAGRIPNLITKASILGFGLNLQVATRQIFSTCEDSYEDYVQAVMRSNRVGSTKELNVHIPITPLERPMVDNTLRKANRVQKDTEEQELLFREVGCGIFGGL